MSSNPPGYNAPPYNPAGSPVFAQTQQQYAQLAQTAQAINTTLNAIWAQLKTGVSLIAQVPTFTFAALPAAATHPGLVVFVSDALKPLEAPGTGTGMLAFSTAAGWFSTAGTALAV